MSMAIEKIRTLQSIHRYQKQDRHIPPHLERHRQQLNLDDELVQSETVTAQSISSMKQDLKFLQEEEAVVRDDHLNECYEKAVEIEDKTKARIIKEMREREKQRRSWDKINFVTAPTHHNNIQRLGIPIGYEDESTQVLWNFLSDPTAKPKWTFITDPVEIERRLSEWQIFHYNQAAETPLSTATVHEQLDPFRKSDEEMKDMFNNTDSVDVSTLQKESQLFVKYLLSNMQPQMPKDKFEISTSVFRTFYKNVKERTSSSPSRLHLGHRKAAALHEDISAVLSTIIDIAVSNEYTLKRWQTVVSVLMEKISGSPFIHKFRTIHLVESDLNFVMRYVWGKNFMKHNEYNRTWHHNQYGGRKGKQGQSAALNKTLSMDIIRHYGESAALIDNDAQACYDRLIPVVLCYSLVRLGLPPHMTRFMCRWLERAEYYLKLGSGLSKHAYKHTLEKYLYGTGQGTGWSPSNWGSISDIISHVMSDNAPGMYMTHPDNKFFSNRSYDAFVDDVNGGLTTDGMKTFHRDSDMSVPLMGSIFDQIQANVELYARLLFTSGGRLALHKCYCYILEFEWKQGIKKMKKTANTYPPLQIDQDFSTSKVPIQLLNPNQARKMLGSITAPDGNTKEQFSTLRDKAKDWGTKIQHGYLNRYDVSTNLKQGLIKSLEYPLGVSLLTEKECDNILAPAMSTFLRRMGLCSTISRTIVFGPRIYGGLQIPNLFTSQGYQKIQLFIGHNRKQDETSKLISISQACIQQEVGISTPILMSSYKKFGCLASNSWIKCLWQFLSTISGSIRQTSPWTPKKCYATDVNIMEQVNSWDIPPVQKIAINLCRLYLRVYYVGELYDTSRTKIKTDINFFYLASIIINSRLFPTLHATSEIYG